MRIYTAMREMFAMLFSPDAPLGAFPTWSTSRDVSTTFGPPTVIEPHPRRRRRAPAASRRVERRARRRRRARRAGGHRRRQLRPPADGEHRRPRDDGRRAHRGRRHRRARARPASPSVTCRSSSRSRRGARRRRSPSAASPSWSHDGQVFTPRASTKMARDARRKPLSVPGARAVRLSATAPPPTRWPIAADGDHLVAIDLRRARWAEARSARGSSRITARSSTAAMDAPLLAVVGDGKITMLSTRARDASRRSTSRWTLPKGAKAPRAVELSPDGKLLAVLVADGNRLVRARRLARRRTATSITAVDLLPGQQLPLVRDLASPPTARPCGSSRATTTRAARAAADAPDRGAHPARTTSLTPGAGDKKRRAPRSCSRCGARSRCRARRRRCASPIARGQPLASGTTIRMPPEKAAVFVCTSLTRSSSSPTSTLDTPAGAQAVGQAVASAAAGHDRARRHQRRRRPAVRDRGDHVGGRSHARRAAAASPPRRG